MPIQRQETSPGRPTKYAMLRRCDICYREMPDFDERLEAVCLCEGIETQFHYRCLCNKIRQFEAANPGVNATCWVCNSPYNIFPKKGYMINFVEVSGNKIITWLDFYTHVVCVYVFSEAALTTYGLMALAYIYGTEGAKKIVLSLHPIIAVTLCMSIPYSAIFIDIFPWEEMVLYGLRRCSNLPVIGRIFPEEFPNAIQEEPRNTSYYQIVGGGMLLPVYAKLVGDIWFSGTDSILHRLVLGGIAFIAVRGILLMYGRQKSYIRTNTMSITTRYRARQW
ncbi:E3 ubiquitin-protein ligase MARCHF5-like [Homalodisca vitripennis]|uniref:E3 ubiquitin-protein ligase MARCHF5-like n=1 Tax=Homalodisca vitripennis TaxID=197043 RepID=UPI001EECB2C1|nr:E3 ubiquitin-protein ligase MARCHF5-like [Homalodisca vitripennis]